MPPLGLRNTHHETGATIEGHANRVEYAAVAQVQGQRVAHIAHAHLIDLDATRVLGLLYVGQYRSVAMVLWRVIGRSSYHY